MSNPLASPLNETQLHLLRMFSRQMSENELDDIKALLSAYYAKKVDDEMDKVWLERQISEDDLDKLLNAHLRIPYK